MKTMLRSMAALAALSLATPVLAFTVWPDTDFEWYANVGKYDARPAPPKTVAEPPARPGYIWSPERWETRELHQTHIPAHWVADDYFAQLAIYNHPEYVAEVTR